MMMDQWNCPHGQHVRQIAVAICGCERPPVVLWTEAEIEASEAFDRGMQQLADSEGEK